MAGAASNVYEKIRNRKQPNHPMWVGCMQRKVSNMILILIDEVVVVVSVCVCVGKWASYYVFIPQ